MSASSVPTWTVSPSGTLICRIFPATGEGTSVSTLSVEISKRGSSRSTDSPSCFSHLVMVPSTTVSPSCGIVTGVATSILLHGRFGRPIEASIAVPSRRFPHIVWRGLPARANMASPTASESVGWGWITAATSEAVASQL